MCGITGIYAFNEVGRFGMINLVAATDKLEKRGPDHHGTFTTHFVGLGHRRLSIIDRSENGRQPMKDEEGRYTIVFNGEIYNYKALREGLRAKGFQFRSDTDTEVLLKLYIDSGPACLQSLNGFFSLAIYDDHEKTLFIARDRIGIKPLYYSFDDDRFLFASEMKSLLAYGINKELDTASLYHYLQLNYIPGPQSIFKNVKKVLPGHYIMVKEGRAEHQEYYKIPYEKGESYATVPDGYEAQQGKLRAQLHKAVRSRLVADVPVGTFLSGGVDSSIISAIAKEYKPDLETFSIGFSDEPFFDETHYAQMVADKLGTRHSVFSLNNDDLLHHLDDILSYIDEPFADSSAIPFYILSKHAREHVTVALSGDGADELFAGYNKHGAFYKAKKGGAAATMVKNLLPLWSVLPKSRSGKISNKVRQLERFAQGMRMGIRDRYWSWATLSSKDEVLGLLHDNLKVSIEEVKVRQAVFLEQIPQGYDMNDLLHVDMQLVLPNDMLTKVDMMSMANGLEVRVPFLDHEVVQYAFQLEESAKINDQQRKRILHDTFREELPVALYHRPKKGFEVPLLKWFRHELQSLIKQDLLNDAFIREQGVFDSRAIKALVQQLYSPNPGDVHAKIWALLVFQSWWKRYM